MTSCSTHVLDAALGKPAAGIATELLRDGTVLAATATDDDGRIKFADELPPGEYSLVFETGPWFAAAQRTTLYPKVNLVFEVTNDQPHYHVALLLSPYSYTTYRGS